MSSTEPTTSYWQTLLNACPVDATDSPYRFAYPVRLPDGRWLRLPIRQRQNDPTRAVASFIANHASFTVLDALATHMAVNVASSTIDVVVGLPTLGLALAPPLARRLGHDRFVPFGNSRKYWYRDELSAEASSITTTAARRLYVDPHLVPLLEGRRVLLVDDTISSGATALAALAILRQVGAQTVGLAFAMSQGAQWRDRLAEHGLEAVGTVSYVFQTPHFRLASERDGWVPIESIFRAV